MSNRVAIGLGSNVADRREKVLNGQEWLLRLLDDVKSSHIYSTPAIGGKGADYENIVIIGKTDEDFHALSAIIKQYEQSQGRNEEQRNLHQTPIDIDIVMWNDDIVKQKDYERSYFQIGFQEICNNQNKAMNTTKKQKQTNLSQLKFYHIASIVSLLASIGYIVMSCDFDKLGWQGFVDDFFMFMAAFSFFNGSFQKAERKFIRRQMFMIAAVFAVMGIVWLTVLAFMR